MCVFAPFYLCSVILAMFLKNCIICEIIHCVTGCSPFLPFFLHRGISMSLLESRDGLHFFAFEHSRDYQQVQFKFFDAVESMDPNNIVVNQSLYSSYFSELLLRLVRSRL